MLRLEVPHCLEKWSNLIEVYQQGQFLGLVYKDIQFQNPEEDYKFFIYSNNMPQM